MSVKIYGTIGPACNDRDILCAMYRAGMTGMRLNLSHMRLDEAAGMLQNIREAAALCGVPTDLLIDMQGPELRVGDPGPGGLLLTEGETVRLDARIPLPAIVSDSLRPGDRLLLDDGQILLTVTDVKTGPTGAREIPARVERGGLLLARKSVAVEGRSYETPAMTEEDRENIRLAAASGVTGVMQPFVRSAEDLRAVRQALDAGGGQKIKLFAKIENRAGVEHYQSFLPCADEIIIARGDLGNAYPLCKLPGLQKRIAAACRSAGKPFMVVTQMLKSMEHAAVPTRAEVSDIYNAVADGASSVMLTAETAVGEYPVEAVTVMAQTVREAEKDRESLR